jgi:DNA repair ATPase RecN
MSENETKKLNKDQLKVVALRQRIGEITSDYEEKIADIRAYVTQMQEQFEEVLQNQEKDVEALQAQLRKYQDAAVQEEGSEATPGATDAATTDYSDED